MTSSGPLPATSLSEELFPLALSRDASQDLSIYIHVPFCRSRCSYCDFFLVSRLDHIDAFFRALAVETLAAAPVLKNRTVKAVHFGGGTPSLVPVGLLAGWLELVSSLCTFSPGMEIALEANPEDLDGGAMEELRAAGINRLSLGVQSYQQRKLSVLGRQHSAEESLRVTGKALERFDTVSADLICGVPDESPEEWREDLKAALAAAVPHLSVYMLAVEPKTLLERRIAKGLTASPVESLQAVMYESAIKMLSGAGYRHYEVSNFACSGHHSRYNLACWMREPYLGFGPSAHSFMRFDGVEMRKANAGSLLRYLANPSGCISFEEILSEEEQYVEHVFLSLRINRGLDVEFLRKHNKLGQNLPDLLSLFSEKGWISIQNGAIYLTPAGFLFADHITGALISG
jgi:oxygen-independent coproporphyrinogen-3 oxidase